MIEHWIWGPRFTAAEMACGCGCGRCEMCPGTMDRLVRVRVRYNRPIVVSSAYRCLPHDMTISPGPRDLRAHTLGMAIDCLVCGPDAVNLLALAIEEGFAGIGVRQHGPHTGRFLHLDDARPPHQRVMWSYNVEIA